MKMELKAISRRVNGFHENIVNYGTRLLLFYFIVLSLIFTFKTVDAGVSVVVQTGMSCPGVSGVGTTLHITGAIGGFPEGGYQPSIYDWYSVEQGRWIFRCDGDGYSWICGWNRMAYEYTNWEQSANSYITGYESYQNFPSAIFQSEAWTWGKGWYWSYNEWVEYETLWEGTGDYC